MTFAASSSNFVSRTGLFGQRVRIGTTEAGKPVYVFEMDLKVHLPAALGGEGEADPTAHLMARTTSQEHGAAASLELDLHQRISASLGDAPG